MISGVKVGESPWWLRRRLETLGVRPVSNIVDVTNYVMFECGQPLHAYDLNLLEERRLVVRRAFPEEKLTAINGRVYELEPSMLVIADAVRPVGLAGVMGGLDTEIGASTTDVLIEAAQFDAMSIRKTARALGLFSPSSFRFERPLDPEAAEWASRRCAELILELAGGSLHPGVIDVGGPRRGREPVALRFAQIPRVLGIGVDRIETRRILTSLGLEVVAESDESITLRPPSWRSDLDREIDLIEEVARIHGYEHIPEDRAVPITSTPRGRRERVESEIRNVLTGLGLDEAATFSLVDEALAAPVEPGPASAPLRVDHSSRRRENALRQSLIPSLLAARRHNEAHGAGDAQLFEIADVYLPREGRALPDEPPRLALAAGRDFRGLRGVVESLVARLHLAEPLSALPVESALFAPGRAAELRVGDVHLGYIGEIDAGQLERFELRGACSAAELDLSVFLDQAQLVPKARPLPSFPAVVRDLSLVVDRSLAWSDLAAVVKESAGHSFRAVEYLDAFQGGNLAEDQQSVHFGLTFRRDDRTLTGEEVEHALKDVVEACSRKFGAKLRG